MPASWLTMRAMSESQANPMPPSITPAAQRLLRQAQMLLTAAGDVPSPCVSVCRMSEHTHLCEGCWRTLDEIAHWSHCSTAQKKAIWVQLAQRISPSSVLP